MMGKEIPPPPLESMSATERGFIEATVAEEPTKMANRSISPATEADTVLDQAKRLAVRISGTYGRMDEKLNGFATAGAPSGEYNHRIVRELQARYFNSMGAELDLIDAQLDLIEDLLDRLAF
jgi:hypothetical protein